MAKVPITTEYVIESWIKKPATPFVLIALIYLMTLVLNDGFMATDEYFTGITRYIPAQTSDLHHLVFEDDVKSPLQILPMHFFAQVALKAGIEQPYWQYRFTLTVLGLINFLILAWVFANYYQGKNPELQKTQWLLFGFFFIAPFAFTRPMFESLAAPWIALTALFGSRYDRSEKPQDLFMAVAAVSMAFVMRQQVGLCALALIALPALKKNARDLFAAVTLGVVLFVLAGIPDYFLRGAFHHSLISILKYNLAHGAEYATHPIYTYPVLIFFMCFGPWWLKFYPKGFWREHLKNYRTEWMILALFVLLHSCFSQKWERFLISMVPVFIILLAPLVWHLWTERAHRPWRFWSLVSLNCLMMVAASFFPPQKNLISLSLYLDKHPEIKTVYRVDETPEWITDAFIRNKSYQYQDLKLQQLRGLSPEQCTDMLVVSKFNENYVDAAKWKYQEMFEVNLIEALAYQFNPTKNVRRAPLLVYRPLLNCEEIERK